MNHVYCGIVWSDDIKDENYIMQAIFQTCMISIVGSYMHNEKEGITPVCEGFFLFFRSLLNSNFLLG